MKTKKYSLDSNVKRFKKRPGRTIIVDLVGWKWNVGSSNIIAYSEYGDRLCEEAWRVKGLSDPNLFDRGKRKRSSDGMVTPHEIADWIRSKYAK